MTHTKAWKVGEGQYTVDGEMEGEQVIVASVGGTSWMRPDGGKNKRYQAERAANFQLILAAPELLEALRAMLRQLKYCESLLDPDEYDVSETSPAEEQANAAITKALVRR